MEARRSTPRSACGGSRAPSLAGGAVPAGPDLCPAEMEAKIMKKRLGWGEQTHRLLTTSAVSYEVSGQFKQKHKYDHCGSRFVLKENNPVRMAWSALMLLLLLYMGTIFLWRVCFVQFQIPAESDDDKPQAAPLEQNGDSWDTFDDAVSYVFFVDLFANFFFSYHDKHLNREIDSMQLIAKRYLKGGGFVINLVACTPSVLVAEIFDAFGGSNNPHLTMAVRMIRLKNISRLLRLIRLVRVADIGLVSRVPLLRWILRYKGGRILRLIFRLAWAIHILACGWYLCAALHDNPQHTWVFRRKISDLPVEEEMVRKPSIDQWMTSMYFVSTVFTTIGFGDISPYTISEITYVAFVMIVGQVVHSIIISEVISILTSNDQIKTFVEQQTKLVLAFAEHAEIGAQVTEDMRSWVGLIARFRANDQYDKEAMKKLITGADMPQAIMAQLPQVLHGGRLINNAIFRTVRDVANVPPRLPVLMALACQHFIFQVGEIVYEVSDYPFNMFLVLHGTFAYVAHPSGQGGGAEAAARCPGGVLESEEGPELFPFQLFSHGAYFGDVEMFCGQLRMATARCEKEGSHAIALHMNDVKSLGDQFLEFDRGWRAAAVRHATTRRRQQAKLIYGRGYRDLAASTIQRDWRRRRREAQVRRRCTLRLSEVMLPGSPRSAESEAGLSKGAFKKLAALAIQQVWRTRQATRSDLGQAGTQLPKPSSAPEERSAEREEPADELRQLRARVQLLQGQGARQSRELREELRGLRASVREALQELRGDQRPLTPAVPEALAPGGVCV